jgi:hypothetical protein
MLAPPAPASAPPPSPVDGEPSKPGKGKQDGPTLDDAYLKDGP